jgi:hypothetical protein
MPRLPQFVKRSIVFAGLIVVISPCLLAWVMAQHSLSDSSRVMQRYTNIDPGRLGFDIDCVVADTMDAFIRLALDDYGIRIRPADITAFEVERCLAVEPRIIEEIFARLLEAPLENGLRPMPGAIDALSALAAYAPLTFITARPLREPIACWLDRVLPAAVFADSRLVATGSHDGKSFHLKKHGLQYFVDDRLDTCAELAAAGFSPIVFDQPWNRGRHAFATVASWAAIKERIIPHAYDLRSQRPDNAAQSGTHR